MEKLKLAIYTQAIGDALGAPFEFDSNPDAQDVADYITSNSVLHYTDDTQLTLATLVGLANKDSDEVKNQYLQWWKTQGLDARAVDYLGHEGLSQFEDYRALRAPGINTMRVLAERVKHNYRKTIGDSNGNGTVMRSLPYIFFPWPHQVGLGLAIEHAIYTHGGDEIAQATNIYWNFAKFGVLPAKDQLKYIMRGGRTAIECVVWAIEAVDRSDTFEECMVKCIAHEGDSDTIAAVAGGLWALHKGQPENFERYKTRLAGKDAIEYALNVWEKYYGQQPR
jgi:ADP-ribosylglycohydrolase